MKKLISLMIATLLCLTCLGFYSCGAPDDTPDSEESTNNRHPVSTGAPDVPIATVAETEPETEPDTTPNIRTLCGSVKAYTAVEPMENVLAVEVYLDGKTQVIHIYTEKAADFCEGDVVEFTYDASAEPMDSYDGTSVWEVLTIAYVPVAVPEKPVIYFYPEIPTEVSVTLTLDGRLTCTYPDYAKGWNGFTAHPDSTLVFPDGKEYYCLYWEGVQNADWDFSKGFCVKGSDTAEFLEWALAEQGLTAREANEFIIYWLPRMQDNPYNVIAFQTDAYTETAVLEITPKPDSLLRICMAYYATDEAIEIEAQTFEGFERNGFVAVEWGGVEIKKP